MVLNDGVRRVSSHIPERCVRVSASSRRLARTREVPRNIQLQEIARRVRRRPISSAATLEIPILKIETLHERINHPHRIVVPNHLIQNLGKKLDWNRDSRDVCHHHSESKPRFPVNQTTNFSHSLEAGTKRHQSRCGGVWMKPDCALADQYLVHAHARRHAATKAMVRPAILGLATPGLLGFARHQGRNFSGSGRDFAGDMGSQARRPLTHSSMLKEWSAPDRMLVWCRPGPGISRLAAGQDGDIDDATAFCLRIAAVRRIQ